MINSQRNRNWNNYIWSIRQSLDFWSRSVCRLHCNDERAVVSE